MKSIFFFVAALTAANANHEPACHLLAPFDCRPDECNLCINRDQEPICLDKTLADYFGNTLSCFNKVEPEENSEFSKLHSIKLKRNVFSNADKCDAIREEAGCNQDAACTWCESRAIPPACYDVEEAASLPASVFKCHKAQEN